MTTGLTRRKILSCAGVIAGAAAGTVAGLAAERAGEAAPLVKLRLLETSDLHMFMMDWDYYRARPDPTVGVVKIATLVREARAQARNSLLFDNGDFLQGSPLGDYMARAASLPSGKTMSSSAAAGAVLATAARKLTLSPKIRMPWPKRSS